MKTRAIMLACVVGAAGLPLGSIATAASHAEVKNELRRVNDRVGSAKKKPAPRLRTPIDGSWKARGTVTQAVRIIALVKGQQFVRTWTITTRCSGRAAQHCATSLRYTSGARNVVVPLTQHKSTWTGTVTPFKFACTAGPDNDGTLSFKLHVTKLAKRNGQKVATRLAGVGRQTAAKHTPCARSKLSVSFQATRS